MLSLEPNLLRIVGRRSRDVRVAVTPERIPLFLPGTGLLGMALVLFWKGAKHSIGA